jgi:hypothetical protein
MTTKAAAILAASILLAALLHGGIYTVAVGGATGVAYRANRFTGQIVVCYPLGNCVPKLMQEGQIPN